MKPILRFISGAVITLASAICAAQNVRVEVHPIQSVTMTDQDFLNGRPDADPVILAGQLRIPQSGANRMPAVVFLHGSGGVGRTVVDWEQELNALGLATFVLDAFTGRGLVAIGANQGLLGRLAMTYDAYRVLEMLEKHPRIDSQRIALMGFSRGGQSALYASIKRFQRLHGPASGRDFAAYIPFYATCNTKFMQDDELSPNPIRMYHGTADNFAPVGPCREYVARLRGRANLVLTEYPGVHHGFDNRAQTKPAFAAKSQSTRNCEFAETQKGFVVNAKTGQSVTPTDPCIELGATVAYSEQAHTEALKAVKELVTTVLLRP